MEKELKKQKLDMLNGSIWNKLPVFALPIAATGILEQLFNASDIAIVGNFAQTDKTAAVAAVGANRLGRACPPARTIRRYSRYCRNRHYP